MRKSIIAISLALGASVVPIAQAAPVIQWGYSVATTWGPSPIFTSGVGTQVITPAEVSWGGDNNGGAAGVGALIVGGGSRSGVLIEGSPKTGSVFTGGAVPQLTSIFSHINNAIDATYATLRTVSTDTALTLTPLDPSNPTLPSFTKTFHIDFSETSNNGNCVVGSLSNCDDIFTISFGSLDQTFAYDSFTYYLNILPVSGPLTSLDQTACTAAGTSWPCLGFLTQEGQKTSVEFGMLITSEPIHVPEPGILALTGLGLMGVFLSRRRKV